MINKTKANYSIVLYVLLTFFFISFLTNILGSLNPSATESFKLTKTMVSFLPFTFFLAYGLMSIPAGLLVERFTPKRLILCAFLLCFFGSILFVIFPNFRFFLGVLFTIGSGMAILQVVINPLLRISGGEENYAFTSVLGQLCFGAASFLAPLVYTKLISVKELDEEAYNLFAGAILRLQEADMSWIFIYLIFAIFAIFMVMITLFLKFPKSDQKEDEKLGNMESFKMLIKSKKVKLFFFAIFAYVGVEQGISFWMSNFLHAYHGFDFETSGANAVANYWGLMTLGGIVGLFMLKLLDSKLVLKLFTFLTIFCLLLGLFGTKYVSLYAFQTSGFFMSVMYPILISLALNSVAKYHGSFAGILMTGIVGGAVFQVLIGFISDCTTLKIGMILNLIGLCYILSVGFWATPLINNKKMTIGRDKN